MICEWKYTGEKFKRRDDSTKGRLDIRRVNVCLRVTDDPTVVSGAWGIGESL